MLVSSKDWDEMMTVKPCGYIISLICISYPAMGEYLNTNIHGENLHIVGDTTVAPGTWIDSTKLYMNTPLYLYNQGRISGDIVVCNTCNAYIQNSGEIHGNIFVPPSSNLTQIIKSTSDITSLNVDGKYKILVYNAEHLEWNDILNAANNTNEIILANSEIIINRNSATFASNLTPNIELKGENTFNVISDELEFNTPLLSNISSSGTINLYIANLNPLYAAYAEIQDGKLYAKMERETDYFKILGNNTGQLLNSLRAANPNDKLIHALDLATDECQLHHILNKSMRIHPDKMARPLQTFNRHKNALFALPDSETAFHITPLGIIGQNINAYGIQTGININDSHSLNISIAAHAADINFTDGIDDFSAPIIGGDIAVQYETTNLFTYSQISLSKAYTIPTSAFLSSVHIAAGPRFTMTDAFTIIPVLGLSGEYSAIVKSDINSAIQTGLMTQYTYQTGDIIYHYNINISANTSKHTQGGIKIGAASPDDETTVYAALNVLNDETGISYSATASIMFNF